MAERYDLSTLEKRTLFYDTVKSGLKRMVSYINAGMLMVPRGPRSGIFDHYHKRDIFRDEALADFERNCSFAELPLPEELKGQYVETLYRMMPKEFSAMDAHLVRFYAEPVIKAFIAEPEQD